jgi:hypothetical protein
VECKSIAPYNFISLPPLSGCGLISPHVTASRRNLLDDYRTSTRHRFTNMRVQNWCGLRAYQKFFSLKHTLSRIRGTSLTYAAVPIVPVVQSLRSVQAVQSRECVKDSYQGLFEVCARSTTRFALGVRNQKALWPFRSRLYGHVQPHPPTGQRHRPRRDRAKHAAHRWPHVAGI